MPTLIVIDFEATCCDRETPHDPDAFPRDEIEIVELGCVAVSETGHVLGEFESFVRPIRNPVLTPYCTALTTISQDQADCDFHGVPSPFVSDEHLNVKFKFAKAQNCRPKGVAAALNRVGRTFDGTAHRGIDDAHNIVRLLPYAGLVRP
ncbi:MAG: 3'-5' exonuclease [Motiliproteus sp.]